MHPGQVGEVLRVDAEVRVEVGDDDPMRVHPAVPNEEPIQVPATPRHRAALADDDAGLERIEDVDELPELVAELFAQRADVGDPILVRLPGNDRADLPFPWPARLGERADRGPQLLERLGVGRDEGKMEDFVGRWRSLVEGRDSPQLGHLLAGTADRRAVRERRGHDPEGRVWPIGLEGGPQLGNTRGRVGERIDPVRPVDFERAAHASVGHDDGAAEPERAAQPVEVEAEDEVRDELRIAEAQPDREDEDRPRDGAGHHLERAAEPEVAVRVVVRHRYRSGRAAGADPDPPRASLSRRG